MWTFGGLLKVSLGALGGGRREREGGSAKRGGGRGVAARSERHTALSSR